MELFINRFSYAPTETEGVLHVGDLQLATMEPPWIPDQHCKGGKPFMSCVPDGTYFLQQWNRPRGKFRDVYIMSNPDLGVYQFKSDIPEGEIARFLCLGHVANFARELVGCFGPGVERTLMRNSRTGLFERAVSDSVKAMRLLISILGREETHTLVIGPQCGTGGTT